MTIKLKDLIIEKISNITYHLTRLDNLYNILKDNYFVLSNILSTSTKDKTINKNKFYFLSTSRMKWNSFNNSLFSIYENFTILVLDGSKLNNRYKGTAVNYWSNNEYYNKHSIDSTGAGFEAEDRIISNEPYIYNAKSYIKEIHIFFCHIPNNLQDLINLAGNIPLFFYIDELDFKLLNKRKSKSIDQIDFLINKNYNLKKIIDDDSEYLKILNSIKNIIDNPKKLTYNDKLILNDLKKTDIITYLSDIITNISHRNMHIYVNLLIRHKINTLEQFSDLLQSKISKIGK